MATSLTDRRVLWLFRNGHYRLADGRVWGKRGPLAFAYCHRGYKFVRLWWRGKRRGIVYHRLVWMVAHGRTVPPGCHVHHKHGKDYDELDDLELLGRAEHYDEHGWGYPAEWDKV